MSNYQERAKQGEEKRQDAFKQKDPETVKDFLEEARELFEQALESAESSHASDEIKQWINAHLGVTHESLAHFQPEEHPRRDQLELARKHLLDAVGLTWQSEQLLKGQNAWGTVRSEWTYAHIGVFFTYLALVQRGEKEKWNFQNAIDAFDKAIEIAEEKGEQYLWPVAHQGLAYRQRAMSSSMKAGDNDNARKNFERVFTAERDSEKKNFWNALYLGATYRALGWRTDEEVDAQNDLADLKKAYHYLKRALQFFEWVADANPQILVQMETLEPFPLYIEHVDTPLPMHALAFMGEPERTKAKSLTDLHKEFREQGPTKEVRKKIDDYYKSLKPKSAPTLQGLRELPSHIDRADEQDKGQEQLVNELYSEIGRLTIQVNRLKKNSGLNPESQ